MTLRVTTAALASVGIKGFVEQQQRRYPADKLQGEAMLPKLAELAVILRLYGIRLIISLDFIMPVRLEPGTADPLDRRAEA